MHSPFNPYSSLSQSRPHALYLACGMLCISMILALPFIYVDVAVRSPAMIRPAGQASIIRNLQSGRVRESFLHENQYVKKGDLLLVLESESLIKQEDYLRRKIETRKMFLQDINRLTRHVSKSANQDGPESSSLPPLNTDFYHQSFARYSQRIMEATANCKKALQDLDRNSKLFRQLVIPASEFEQFQYELLKAENGLRQIREDQLSQWSSEQKVHLEEQYDLQSQLSRILEEKKALAIYAPVSGSVQNLAGVYIGSTVNANQELGVISPDTSMIVIAYVQPSDIGLIRNEMPVNIQVNAFNYNQWGIATGHVLEVPQDIKIIESQPIFEVRCSIDKPYLELKTGYRGFLKKGMSLQARFTVTNRSLWQLLYDKIDNWINPSLQ